MTPAPGQGALAIECRADDVGRLSGPTGLGALEHAPTRLAVTAERAVLARLGAGCSAPVGALGHVRPDGALDLAAVTVTADGAAVRIGASTAHATPDSAAGLGERLADELLSLGPGATPPPDPSTSRRLHGR